MQAWLAAAAPSDGVLGWLITVSVGVAVVAGFASVVAACSPRRAAWRRLALAQALVWCLAFPLLAAIPAATGRSLFAVALPGQPRSEASAGPAAVDCAAPASVATSTPSPGRRPSADASLLSPDPAPTLPFTCPAPADIVSPAAPSQDASLQVGPGSRAGSTPAAGPWRRVVLGGAAEVWLVVSLGLLLRLAAGGRRLVRLRRSAHVVTDLRVSGLWRQAVGDWRSAPPRLLATDERAPPLAVGFGRPAVVIPATLPAALDDASLLDVLRHEAAHVRHGDLTLVLLEAVAAAVFWPIPTIHLLLQRLRQAREDVCDDAVLAHREPVAYGETLLAVASLLAGSRPVLVAAGMLGGRGGLERRVASLLHPRRIVMSTCRRRVAVAATAVWCVLAALGLAGRLMVAAPSCTACVANASAAAESMPSSVAAEPAPSPAASEPAPSPAAADKAGRAPAAANPDRPVVLRGRVVDPQGRPVAAARIHLTISEWVAPLELGVSGADGGYRFSVREATLRRTVSSGYGLATCQAALIAVAPGFGTGYVLLPSFGGGRFELTGPDYAFDLRLVDDAPIAGRVIDGAGGPKAGVRVSVDRLHELAGRQWWKMAKAIETNDVDLMDHREANVCDWSTAHYPTAWEALPAAVTDADGRFRLVGAGAGRAVRLRVDGPGIRATSLAVVNRRDADRLVDGLRARFPKVGGKPADQGLPLYGPAPTIEVEAARTMAGVVRDATTGRPLAGVAINAGAAGARTGRDGRYRLVHDVDAGMLQVMVHDGSEEHLSEIRHLAVAGQAEVVADFDLSPGVAVEGRVVEAGTDTPIVSGHRHHCHDVGDGPLVAGYVQYHPLATNAALRDTPAGRWFAGGVNYVVSAEIGADGRFVMHVPPGPGVLLVQAAPGMPMFAEQLPGSDSAGLHRLFPYPTLAERTRDDGAPAGDARHLPGFAGLLPVNGMHAYRVIRPAAGAAKLAVTIDVPRPPGRKVRFATPEGGPVAGVRVKGVLAPPHLMSVSYPGDEAELLALAAGQSRAVAALSRDGRFAGQATVTADAPYATVRMERSASVAGRLVDKDRRPMAGWTVYASYPDESIAWGLVGPVDAKPIVTDADGRFAVEGLLPSLSVAVMFQRPAQSGFGSDERRPAALKGMTLKSGESRPLGDIVDQ